MGVSANKSVPFVPYRGEVLQSETKEAANTQERGMEPVKKVGMEIAFIY